MKKARAASYAAASFAVAVAFGSNGQDTTCGKNHYILAYAVSPWTATGNLNVARSLHTATLLPDGRVLVAGGRGAGSVALDSAEIYDPISGQWSITGNLVKPRAMPTATLLPNGKILVVGGDESGEPFDFARTATAELYDPVTGMWALTDSMGTVRSGHAAALLQDGRVLVAGGFNIDNVKTAELYDPATGAWTPTGDLNVARYGHTATTLPDGRVLVAKGSNDGDLAFSLSSAELYDPISGTWNLIDDPTHYASVLHTATLLPDGTVLFTGGYPGNRGQGDPATLALSESFNPVIGTWEIVGNLNEARNSHTATLLPDGRLLVAGGFDWNIRQYPGGTELYDPATATWVIAASLGTPRSGHTATLLADGSILVVGGETDLYGAITLDSGELYAPPANNTCQ